MQTIDDRVNRIAELDGVRGVAILLILLWHYIQNNLVAGVGTPLAFFKQSLGFTWSGVDLFFVLSGFLIGGILIDKKDKSNFFRVFYIRRICRIFPLYYLYLLVSLIMLYAVVGDVSSLRKLMHVDEVPFWSYLTYTQNIFMGANNSAGIAWFTVTWSLAVEEQFYIFFPLIVFAFRRSFLPYVLLWFAIMAVYLRYSMPGLSAYLNMPWRVDSLMTGALLAWLVRMHWFNQFIDRKRILLAGVLVLLAGGLFYVGQNGGLVLGGAVTHLSLSVFYALFMLYVLRFRNGLLAAIMRSRVLVWLGMISYGVYLIHGNVNQITHRLVQNGNTQITQWPDLLVTLLALVITLALALLSYVVFERRFIRYGHKYRYTD